MAKAKKSFDKEMMYKKIMPTNLKKNNNSDVEGRENDSNKDAVYQEGLISINANTVYLNENLKPEEEVTEINDANDKVGKIESEKTKDIVDEKEAVETEKSEEKLIKSDENKIIIYNVMESLVMEKLDIALQKMNCCKCDRCKDDIVALALNSLKPMYIVKTKGEIDIRKEEYSKLGLEVTTAVLKAVLAVRRNPRH